MDKPPITIEQVYNSIKKKFHNNEVILDQNNKFILNEELKKEGWKLDEGFQDKSNPQIVLNRINKLVDSKYEVAIAFINAPDLEPWSSIRCLLKKDTLKN